MPSLSTLTAADFEPYNGGDFTLQGAGGELTLKLTEVRPLGAARREGGAFSLVFVTPAGPFLPQAIYPMTHPMLGTLELFVVPLGPENGGNRYEVIFT